MAQRYYREFNRLAKNVRCGQIGQFVYAVFTLLILLHSGAMWAGEDHDHEQNDLPTKTRGKISRHDGKDHCRVEPAQLARVASGESMEIGPIVTYVTDPGCLGESANFAVEVKRQNLKFSSKYPYRLDQFATALGNSEEEIRNMDSQVASLAEEWFRSQPLAYKEAVPMIAQMAFISPKAARRGVGELVKQELMSAQGNGRGVTLARSLLKLGANEPAIAQSLGESVEQMALQSQAESLRIVLSSLTDAASNEPRLVPTLVVSSSAFSRGVKRAQDIYSEEGKKQMALTAFSVVATPGMATVDIKPAAGEMNEALSTLLEAENVKIHVAKKLWKEVLSVLAKTSTQQGLARAVATSLNPDVLYLPEHSRILLLMGARHYPELARSIQSNLLIEWRGLKRDTFDGKINPNSLLQWREKFVRPMTSGVLDLEAGSIDYDFLREVWRDGIVSAQDIEAKFPTFYLSNVEKRSRMLEQARQEVSTENSLASIAGGFGSLWSLTQVEAPALFEWVDNQSE